MRHSTALLALVTMAVAVMGHGSEGGHDHDAGHGHAHDTGGAEGSTVGGGEGGGKQQAAGIDEAGQTGQKRVDEGLIARQEAWSKCDRKRSRLVRGILQEEVYPIVEKRGYEFPAACPLSKKTDMYLDNELVSEPSLSRVGPSH